MKFGTYLRSRPPGAFLRGVIGISFLSLLYLYFRESIGGVSDLVFGVVAAGAAFYGVIEYLNHVAGRETSRRDRDPSGQELAAAVEQLKSDLAIAQLRNAPQSELAQTLANVREIITNEIAIALDQRFSPEAIKARQFVLVRSLFARDRQRLGDETRKQEAKGNFNLAIGIVSTFVAALMLGYLVVTAPSSFKNATELAAHYIPRISTVVFIEVFSFFFLRLYRAGLAETKYYQNELTTLAAFEISFEAASSAADNSFVLKVIEELSKTNRNAEAMATATRDRDIDYKDLLQLAEQATKVAAQTSKH